MFNLNWRNIGPAHQPHYPLILKIVELNMLITEICIALQWYLFEVSAEINCWLQFNLTISRYLHL